MTGLAGSRGSRQAGVMRGRHPNGSGWAWVVVALLTLVVLVETVVLAVMASLVSLFAAIAVPVVVLVVAVFLVRDVRRHWVSRREESVSWEELSA
jgi:type IV secretory pathway TrbL component